MRTLVATLFLALFVVACGTETAPPSESPSPTTEATIEATTAGANMLGGCILTTPIGEVPNDLYLMTDVVPTDEYPPFTKKLTVYGLTLVARDDASDDFMRLVARTITEIFPRIRISTSQRKRRYSGTSICTRRSSRFPWAKT